MPETRVEEAAFLASLASAGHHVAYRTLPDGADALVLCPPVRPDACLVLYHGGGNDRLYGFWYLIERMLAKGVAVVTADLPGHGVGAHDAYTLERARERLDALVRAATTETGNSNVVVLGQSMGGAFALDQLIRNELAAGVVAVSVPLELALGPAVLLELLAVLKPEARRVLRYASPARAWPAFGPFGRDRFPIRVPAGESYVAAFRRSLAALDLSRRLAGLGQRRPVLLIHGTWDGVAPSSQAVAIASLLGEQASLLSVSGGSHFDVLLRDTVIDHIQGWLQALGSEHQTFTPKSGNPSP